MKIPLLHRSWLCSRLPAPRAAWLRSFCLSAGIEPLAFLGLLFTGSLSVALPEARAQATATLTTIYSFKDTGDGIFPNALVKGGDGNFYGTTSGEGTAGDYGTIFKVTPAGVLSTIYSFEGGTAGRTPTAELAIGSDGNFYGTALGGTSTGGTVYQLTPAGAFAILYSLSISDGLSPAAKLVQGSDGSFYGTAAYGGTTYVDGYYNPGDGTIFKVTPAGVFTKLHDFTGSDGSRPQDGLVRGTDGNFYGTTFYGGTHGQGAVYQITPDGVFTLLYSFTGGSDGFSPNPLVLGSDGNFYGTATGNVFATSTENSLGTVFQVTPAGVLTTLYHFSGPDGTEPEGRLAQGSDGNFYGTTIQGGTGYVNQNTSGAGTVFQVTPAGALTTLYDFDGSISAEAAGSLVQGNDGSFFGTAGASTIFKLTVSGLYIRPTFFTGEASLGSSVYYLTFSNGNFFGYYSFLNDPDYIYHFDLGYEYVFDANDGQGGVYLYDFASSDFFYTSPTFPFPYLYDFNLKSVLYYYPDTSNAGHYTSNPRTFYDFATGQIITK